MILFKKLRWKNLLSTGNLFTEIDLNVHSTTLIIGENGAGKSTILDALSFALFNKPFRKISKTQLVNSITKKDTIVEIEFNINTIEYKIIRGIKPNKFELYQNGILINQSAEMRDYQEVLEKQILKINHKSFCQVVVLGSATFQPFMQLTAAQRRDIIEDLLDLQIFTVMNTLLKDKIANNKEALTNKQFEDKLADEKIEMIKQHIKQVRSNNKAVIEDKQKLIDDANSKIDTLHTQYDEIASTAQDLAAKTNNIESYEKKLAKLDNLKHKIEAKQSVLNKDLAFFANHDNCPTCRQEIEQSFKSDIIQTHQVDIKEIEQGLAQLIEQRDQVKKELNEMNAINRQVADLVMDLNIIKTKVSSQKQYISQLQNEISSLNETADKEDKHQLDQLVSDRDKLRQELACLNSEREIYAAAGTLLKDGGIKSKIIKQYIPIINKLINKYLSAMDFFVQFELDEEFNETIKSRYRDAFSYASFSEGEKMRINLAILFTWRAIAKLRNSINTNILIMDEVFDSSLDAQGIDEFMKILNTITVDTNTFIISHKTDQISDKFNNVLKFEKHKNFSKIAA